MTEYASKPWPIRAYRWLRWRPWFFVKFCYWMTAWVTRGAKLPWMTYRVTKTPIFPTRRSYVGHLWTVSRSLTDFKIGNWLTLDDWMAELRQSR